MVFFSFFQPYLLVIMSHSVLKDVLPADYGFVVLVAVDGLAVNFYLMKKVVDARKEFGVEVCSQNIL